MELLLIEIERNIIQIRNSDTSIRNENLVPGRSSFRCFQRITGG